MAFNRKDKGSNPLDPKTSVFIPVAALEELTTSCLPLLAYHFLLILYFYTCDEV